MTDDPFIGHWEMDPADNQYELGWPPAIASYIIEPFGERTLDTETVKNSVVIATGRRVLSQNEQSIPSRKPARSRMVRNSPIYPFLVVDNSN